MPDEAAHPPELAEYPIRDLINEIFRRSDCGCITIKLSHESPGTPKICILTKCESNPFAFLGMMHMATNSVLRLVSEETAASDDEKPI